MLSIHGQLDNLFVDCTGGKRDTLPHIEPKAQRSASYHVMFMLASFSCEFCGSWRVPQEYRTSNILVIGARDRRGGQGTPPVCLNSPLITPADLFSRYSMNVSVATSKPMMAQDLLPHIALLVIKVADMNTNIGYLQNIPETAVCKAWNETLNP